MEDDMLTSRPYSLPILLGALLCLSTAASAEVSFGLGFNSQGLDSFYLNISNYYHVPQDRVVYVRDSRIPDDEIPVVFFLATQARVGPEVIVQRRLSGESWMSIMLFYRLSPAILYVPVSVVPGPPYGNAYGYYRKYPKHRWNKIRMADADIVNFVNLRFMSEHHGYKPEEVFKLRSEGRRFHEISRGKSDEAKDKGGPGGGKGKGKGNKGKK